MRSVLSYFIKYPVVVNLILLLFVLFGWLGFKSLKSSLFPEVDAKFINVQVVYPGASPEEMEEGVVLKIEDNLKGITGIDRVTSTSSENAATVRVELATGADPDVLLADVKNAVDKISSFPTGMEPPVIYKVETLNFTISFALSGEANLNTLKKFAKDIENDLRGIEGISKVAISGYPDEEIEISLRERDMRAYQLTFDQVSTAVRKANLEITGGSIKGEDEEVLIRARAKRYFADELSQIIVKADADGRVVRLQDIAELKDRWSDNPNRSYLNGKPSVVVTVNSTVKEDILTNAESIRAYLEKFNERNDIVHATVISDGTVVLQQRIDLLKNNGITGAFLVLFFLALFLNLRVSFWVAIGIPVSFLGMFVIAAMYGLTINVISLFGMIIVIGILVDDGVVVSENIFQHYERGKKPVQAAIDGTLEVLPSVISAVITTMVAFSIFFFLEGRIGDFFKDIGFVVIVTLAVSLMEVFLTLPSHIAHSKALKKGQKTSRFEVAMERFMNYMREKIYAPFLRFTMANRFFVIAVAISTFVLSIGAIKGNLVKLTFFPIIEADNIQVAFEMPAGTREHVTEKHLAYMEQVAWQVSKEYKQNREDSLDIILNIERKIGPKSHQGSLNIILLDGETRQVRNMELSNVLRERVGAIPGADKLSFGSNTPFGKPVSISLQGNDLKMLQAAKQDLKAELVKMKSLRDVIDTDQEGLREINITLKEKAQLLGLSLQDVLVQVRQGFFGNEVQRLQRGTDEVRIWVRYESADRSNIGQLEDMRIRLANGREYPLREIADLKMERGVIAINHIDGKREIKVEADISNPGESVPLLLSEIQDDIMPAIYAKYPGVKGSFEGQNREQLKTSRSVGKAGPVVLIIILALIVLTFRSFTQAAIVFILVPFSLVGVVWGHYIHGAQISIFSWMGVIALVGVLINDSLVFVSTFNGMLKEGKPYMQAIYDTGRSRFRPILLTSVTTVAGLAPLILEKSFQAQFLVPMAISIAYGLIMATFLTLGLLPALLIMLNRVKMYITWLWTGEKPSEESVEPAVKELESENEYQHA